MTSWTIRTAYRPQRECSLLGALVALSTLVGRKIRDRSNCRPNLYGVMVGATGCGKEYARTRVKDLLCEVGLIDVLVEDFRSGRAILAALEQNPVALLLWDEYGDAMATIRNSRQAHHLQEIVNNLLRLYTSAGTVFMGQSFADATKKQRIVQPHLAMMGSTTESTLFAAMCEAMILNGMSNRTIYFWSEGETPLTDPVYERCPVSLVDYAQYWVDLRPGGSCSGSEPEATPEQDIMEYTSEARDMLRQYMKDCDAKRAEMKHEWEKALRVRQVEQVRRLAMLHAVSGNPENRTIGCDAVMWATEVVDHCTSRMIFHASTRIASNEYEGDMLKILKFVREQGEHGANGETIARRFRGIKAQARKDLLAHLLEAGDLVSDTIKTKGRTGYVYRVRGSGDVQFREISGSGDDVDHADDRRKVVPQ